MFTFDYGSFKKATSNNYNSPKKSLNKKRFFNSTRKREPPSNNRKAIFPIGIKLISIISLLVVVSLGLITFLVSYYVTADTRINAEENNLTINSRTASDLDNRFSSIISSTSLFYDMVSSSTDNREINRSAVRFFERNRDIQAIYFITSNERFINKTFALSHDIDSESFDYYIETEKNNIDEVSKGETIVLNSSPFFGTPSMALMYPISGSNRTEITVILFSSESIADNFSTGTINLSCFVNSNGDVLVHSDIDKVLNGFNMKDNHLIKDMIENNQNNKQIIYRDEDGVEYFGAYKKLSDVNCAVITEVKSSIVLEAVNATTRRNIYLTISILSLAILVIWFFSKSISEPLELLTQVTEEISKGNFNTNLFDELRENRKDEIGVLVSSTKDEREILNTVTKLTNLGVTKAIVRKEIDFEPHLKDITIFFSDIRGFTAISDGFQKRFGEKSAAEIIGFLNDYMSRMVNCITITGGTVDKFEGDAIMAVWGALRDENLEYELMNPTEVESIKLRTLHEEHIRSDAINAIRGTIAMRYALMKYNKDAEIFTKAHENDNLSQYKPKIRIGCGLNSGRATVGFMGSNHKMEFTSIGDAVNLASRTESSNKPCGTDILITEDTYNLIKYDYIRCKENNYTLKEENKKYEIIVEVIPVTFEVKGKGKQHFYGVVNMPLFDIEEFFRTTDPDFVLDEDCALCVGPEGPKTLDDVRNLLGIPKPNFGEVNLDEEENKVKIN